MGKNSKADQAGVKQSRVKQSEDVQKNAPAATNDSDRGAGLKVESDAPEASAAAVNGKVADRSMRIIQRGAGEVWHHLFKLLPAKVSKDHGWDPEQPKIILHEHTHAFHTVDSSGKQMTQTSAVAGHFHEVKVIQSADPTERPTIEISHAKRLVRRTVRKGVYRNFVEDYNETNDEGAAIRPHTHEYEYHGSDLIKVRTINPEFSKLQAELAQKAPKPIAGVIG